MNEMLLVLNFDINNFFPLSPDIWGNVSDWVMVMVAAATGYLVWRTLKSQTAVQKLQQKGLQLELEKSRKQLLPEVLARHKGNIKREEIHYCVLSFMCKKNECFDIHVEVFYKRSITQDDYKFLKRLHFDRFAEGIEHVFEVENLNFPIASQITFQSLKCELTYKDAIDNQYSQEIYFDQNFGGFKATIEKPLLISNT